MSPLFMDTGYEVNSPGSLSAEERRSNNAEYEREAEGQQMGKKSRKRQEKNRDAARKSRRKQTERADELHEELQNLERSNSALKREIATLKKDFQLYTTALERHQPVCRLKRSASNSSTATNLPVSPSASCQASPSPPRVPPHASSPTLAAAPSFSTSKLGLQSHKSARLSPSTPPTTLASSSSSSPDLFTLSSSVAAPPFVSFSAAPAAHSLFSQHPPTPVTPRPTNVAPRCANLVSSPLPSSSLPVATQPQSGLDTIHENSLMSAHASFSPLHSSELDDLLLKQTSFLTASSNVGPSYSHLEAGLAAQGCSMNVPQLSPSQLIRNPVNFGQPRPLLPPTLQSPALQPLSAPPSAAAGQVMVNPTSLLSLLTVPSPPDVPQTTSSGFEGHPSQTLPWLGDPQKDLSLSELLEGNDWILSGSCHQ